MNDDANGEYFPRLINHAYFLFRNEIAHTTNYEKLLGSNIVYDRDMRGWLRSRPKNATYDSKETARELLTCCASVIRNTVLAQIHKSIERFNCYAYLGDETSDRTRKEQVCHVIRYLKDNGEPSESFIGIDHAQATNAEALTTLTVHRLENSNISLQKMTACGFDGGSAYAGRNTGVQARLRQLKNAPMVYVHCNAHLVNLVGVNASKGSSIVKKTLLTISSLVSFFSASTKRTERFKRIQENMEMDKLSLVAPVITRWLSYDQAVQRMIIRYVPIIICLQEVNLQKKISLRLTFLALDHRNEQCRGGIHFGYRPTPQFTQL